MGNSLDWPPGPKCFISNGCKKDMFVARHEEDIRNPSVVRLAAGQKLMFYGYTVVVSIKSVDGEDTITSNYKIPHSRSVIITETGGIIMSKWFNHWESADGVCHKRRS